MFRLKRTEKHFFHKLNYFDRKEGNDSIHPCTCTPVENFQQVETHCSNQTYTLRHRGDPYQAGIGNSCHLQVCGVGIVLLKNNNNKRNNNLNVDPHDHCPCLLHLFGSSFKIFVPLTVTVKEHRAIFPALSRA